MARTITTIDERSSLAVPSEAIRRAVEAGAELDIEVVGRAVVVRSIAEAEAFPRVP